jgi:hypothetical protein
MKKTIITTLAIALCIVDSFAQDLTQHLTVYPEYKSAIVHMTDGRDVRTSLANIFLKNSSLLFMRGSNSMEADMSTIAGADFDDRKYVTIEKQLAYLVDSVRGNSLYCVTLVDIDSYQRMLRNNVTITDLRFSDQIDVTSVDPETLEHQQLPVIRQYYFLYNGEFVRVHDREIARKLSKDKEKQRLFKTVISMNNFSWTDEQSLMLLLKSISN